jgi:hypothetical protein
MRRVGGVFAVLLVIALPQLCVETGHADGGDEPQYAAFYTPPDPLPPGQPGDLIRTEPSRLVLEPSGQLGAIVASGTRIMYRSTDTRGNPVAVTGTYFEPDNPWPGNGPRPLISYAPGTQGQGNQCAPSRMFNQGIHYSGGWDIMFNYEELFVATMVARGFAIVMTDYEGLGTPSMHTYVGRVAEGQAVLDAARAASSSVMAAYPEAADAIRSKMTPRGLAMLESVSRQCVGQTLIDFMFRHLQPYFTEDINQLVNEEPFSSLLDAQRIGRYKPNAPVLINSNRYDPLVPHGPVVRLGHDWCAQGADIDFRTNEEPPFLNKLIINHGLPMLVDGEPAMQWIAARFNGEPTAPNCGQF